ncbi:MAG TPA: CHASE domain-containing protein [Gammaproteobacteria bacterium]|nr:CHASE domain-containing protein [Gammaproteobacteria bacterium]
MSITDHKPLEKLPLAWGVGALCCLLGLLEMGAWPAGYPAGMQFITAFNFVCAGAGLIALSRRKLWPARVCAAWLAATGLLTVLEYVFGINLGIDNVTIPGELQIPAEHPGRMDFNSAFCFALSGTVLLFLGMRLHYTRRMLLIGLACMALMVASSVLISHLSVFIRAARHPFTQMTLQTSAGFVALASGMIGMMRLQIKAAGIRAPGAWPALAASLILTLGTWYTVTGYMTKAAQARFDAAVQEMESTIEQRMQAYEQVLQGSKGLLVASERVSRKEWHQYITSLQLQERNPGIQAVGFAPRISADAAASHVQSAHAEGFAGYHLWPGESTHAEYFPVFYIEPFDWLNRRYFGYDMYSEPVRRAAMERARDTGEPALTAKLSLMQETRGDVQSGFVMYLPVYKNSADAADSPETNSPEQRRLKLTGFVFSPFRANDLFDSIQIIHQFNINFKVFDEQEAVTAALLYNAGRNQPKNHQEYLPEFETNRQLVVGGRKWRLNFSSRPAFDSGVTAYQPALILLGGTLVAFLMFAIFYAMGSSRSRAIMLAHEMTLKLRDSETRYRNLVHNSLGLICSHDESGRLIYVNPAGANILGYTETELLGKNMRELMPDDVKSKFDEYLVRVKEKKRDTGVMVVLTREGQRLVWRYDNTYYKTDDGTGYVLGHAQDVTEMYHVQGELKKANALMLEMATHDPLTGLCNRALLQEHMDKCIDYASRYKQFMAVLFLDLDGFKQVNDTLGHSVGDGLLKGVAQGLTAICRKSDIIARFGGDEFVMLLVNITAPADAAIVARKICDHIKNDMVIGNRTITVSASIGIACYPADGTTTESLLQNADAAMYSAKQSGKNVYRFYHPSESPPDPPSA